MTDSEQIQAIIESGLASLENMAAYAAEEEGTGSNPDIAAAREALKATSIMALLVVLRDSCDVAADALSDQQDECEARRVHPRTATVRKISAKLTEALKLIEAAG